MADLTSSLRIWRSAQFTSLFRGVYRKKTQQKNTFSKLVFSLKINSFAIVGPSAHPLVSSEYIVRNEEGRKRVEAAIAIGVNFGKKLRLNACQGERTARNSIVNQSELRNNSAYKKKC